MHTMSLVKEDLSRLNWKIVDWDVKNQIKQWAWLWQDLVNCIKIDTNCKSSSEIYWDRYCFGFVIKLQFSSNIFLSLNIDFIFANRDAA